VQWWWTSRGNCQRGAICALRIRKATSDSSEECLDLILTAEMIWIDIHLFSLNLQILVTAEIASELLGLV